jgi:hypothetical protein
MSKRYLFRLALCASAAASTATSTAAAQPRGQGPTAGLHRFLHGQLGPAAEAGEDTRYTAAFVDLNGDRRDEALVYVTGANWCGSGGCRLLVLRSQGGSWRLVTRTSVTSTPIRVLSTSSRGWRDIAVQVSGGGVRPFEARLSYNGRSYPTNPSVARPAPRRAAGRVMISGDPGRRPLFP